MKARRSANGQGSPTGWAGSWGPMADGRSKVRRLARRIEAELLEGYVVDMPWKARKVRSAARYTALAEATLERLGADPKATRRSAAARGPGGGAGGRRRGAAPARAGGEARRPVSRARGAGLLGRRGDGCADRDAGAASGGRRPGVHGGCRAARLGAPETARAGGGR